MTTDELPITVAEDPASSEPDESPARDDRRSLITRLRSAELASKLAPAGVYLGLQLVVLTILGLMSASRNGPTPIERLRSWDGEWLLAIAAKGYENIPSNLVDGSDHRTPETAYAFFPGYPSVTSVVSWLTSGHILLAGVIVSTVAGVAAAYGLMRLAETLPTALTPGGARRVGLILVALFATAPMSVVFSMAYTEALFCALAVWALVGVVRRQWLVAGLCACGAGLVRPTGAMLIFTVVLAAVVAAVAGRSARPLLAALLAPLGQLAYLGYVGWRTGSPTGWFKIQRDGWNSQFDGGAAFRRFALKVLTDSQELFDFAVLFSFIASIVLIVIAIRMRVPWPLVVYAAAVSIVIAASDGHMQSHVRMLLPAFPLLIPIAVGLARRRTSTAVAVVVSAALVFGWFGGYALTIWPYAI